VCICLLLAAGALAAQIGGTGSIQGVISDPSGAVIPGATVTCTNVATGVKTTRQTTAAGLYVLSPLPPGRYTVSASASGFQTMVQEDVVVDALSNVGLNLTLPVGSTTESITVTGAPPQLNTVDARLGATMRNDLYTALPLSVGVSGIGAGPRNPGAFIYLLPGVQGGGSDRWGYFNGGQAFSKDVYVEGVPITDPIQQGEGRSINLGISVEAIEQFQVETSGQSVEFQGQGSENYMVKSGTNQLHGSAFEYLRNTAFDARAFFADKRAVQHQNEFGFTIGGPLKKNRIFYFGTYDGWRYKQQQTARYASIPTLKQRQGDFSELSVAVYDPRSTTTVGNVTSRQPFPGNKLNYISPFSAAFQQYLPEPTNSGLTSNYLGSLLIGQNNDNGTVKVDANLTDAHRLSYLFTRGRRGPTTPYREDPAPIPLPYTDTRIVDEVPTVMQLKHNWVISPSLLNQLTLGFNRLWVPITSATMDGKYASPSSVGMKGLPHGEADLSFPQVGFSGPNAPTSWHMPNSGTFTDCNNTFTVQDSAQWIRSKHAVKFGFQAQRLQDNYKARNTGNVFRANFSNAQTEGFSATGTPLTSTGHAYASYLLGALSSANINDDWVVAIGARYRSYSWWGQDDFRVTSRLTLNLGLRWDLMRPYNEVKDRMSFMDPNAPNPAIGGYPGALRFADNYAPAAISCNCRTPIKTYYGAWSPRLGLAYSLNKDTVVRAAYGVMYTRRGAVGGREGARDGTGTLGFNAAPGFTSLDGYSPTFYWQDGVPAYQHAPFFDATLNTGFATGQPAAGGVSYGYPDGKPPRYQNWNFSIQRALLPTLTVTVAYAGMHGTYLNGAGRGMWTNQMEPKYLALGNLLNSQATAANLTAAQAIVPGVKLPYSNYSGTITQMLRPFPQYSSVSDNFGNVGQGNYHAMQLTVTKRLSGGLTMNVNYALSKAINNVSGGRSAYDWSNAKTISSLDQTHVLNGTFAYSLPFGKGHRLGGGNPVVAQIVGGWRVSGITRIQSGLPFGAIGASCNLPNAGGCMASFASGFSGPVRINGDWGEGSVRNTATAPAYIDVKAFVSPAAYTYGDTPPTAAKNLRQPPLFNQDLSLRRQFRVTERVTFSLQGDAFNLFNNVRFGGISTSITSSSFGKVTSQANSPRTMQLVARIEF
jgi:hypothetical protein